MVSIKTCVQAVSILLFAITAILILTQHPYLMEKLPTFINFFLVFPFLSLLVPDRKKHIATRLDCIKLFSCIASIEVFLFFLCYDFGLYSFSIPQKIFHTPSQYAINWLTWIGLWTYFSLMVTIQHFAHSELHQPNVPGALTFTHANTYLDTALKRGFAITQLILNFTGIHILLISVVLILLNLLENDILQKFYLGSLLYLWLFLFFNIKINQPGAKKFFGHMNLPNLLYIILACLSYYLALLTGSLIFHLLPNTEFFIEKILTTGIIIKAIDARSIMFISIFILLTPLFASLIVKYTARINRKTLLFSSFFLPQCLYGLFFILHGSLFEQSQQSPWLFILLGSIFFIFFFRKKTTTDYISGALALPNQRIILATKSYRLFPGSCLMLFNLYFLATVIGLNCVYAITVFIAVFSAMLGIIGILSYFGKSYRLHHSIKEQPNFLRLI